MAKTTKKGRTHGRGVESTGSAYLAALDRARTAMARIEGRMERHTELHRAQPLRWDIVGDMVHVAERLEEVAGFLAMPNSQLGVGE